ncbi:MAG: hypothetical protein II707_04150 [Spirochaetales bacterium]|nr:hypothetical protein [Spirochaetales bacterium]
MACFTVPLAEAVVVSAAKAVILRKGGNHTEEKLEKIKKMRENVGILEKMLYGGSALLAVEHLFHGEIMLYPPFLTAMQTPENIPEMLHEISTVGVGMALTVTAAWAIAMGVRAIMKRFAKKSISDNAM